MDEHILEAKSHGVSGFIATWWGQGSYEDGSFALLLAHAEQADFKTSIYWETAPGSGPEQIDRAIADLVYVLSRYGANKAFLKVGQKPVIFVYGRVMQEVPMASWPMIIEGARAKAGDFLLITDGYEPTSARLFDGVHVYNNCGDVKGKSPDDLRAWAAHSYAEAVSLARRHGRISCVTVIPGYDDTKVRQPGMAVSRQKGQTYSVLWEEARRAQPDWILITSWNEWHEGSEIESSWEDGNQYLKLTAQYAPDFLAAPTSRRGSIFGIYHRLAARHRGGGVLADRRWFALQGIDLGGCRRSSNVQPQKFPRRSPDRGRILFIHRQSCG
jgi:hypothetical protein